MFTQTNLNIQHLPFFIFTRTFYSSFQMKLQRVELLKLIEFTKVLNQEKEGDKIIIRRQQEIINTLAREEDDSRNVN